MKNKAPKRLICGLLMLFGSFPCACFALPLSSQTDTVTGSNYHIRTIIVDAGHGGRQHSGSGNFSLGASGGYSYERNVALAIALKLQKEIEKEMPDVKVVLTRTTEDDVAWQRRAQIANENKGDLFISLHCNSLPDKHVSESVVHKHHKPVYKYVSVPDRSGR